MRLWRQAGGAAGNPSPQCSPSDAAPSAVLTTEGYSGLEALLSEHAEEVLKDVTAKNPESGQVVEYLFRAITEIDAEGRGIRRPRRLSVLVGATGGNRPVLEQVIQHFSRPDCGFLVRSLGDDPVIDIGHEALIRCWRRLNDSTIDSLTGLPRGWVQREREDGQIWRALVVTVEHEFAAEQASAFSWRWKRKLRSILEFRLIWFNDIPGTRWADRYGGKWELISDLMALAQRLKQSRRVTLRFGAGWFLFFYIAVFFITFIYHKEGREFSEQYFVLLSLAFYLPVIAYFVYHARTPRKTSGG
jgi:hypothetical protein